MTSSTHSHDHSHGHGHHSHHHSHGVHDHAAHAAHNAEHYDKHAAELDDQPFIRPYLHWLHETFSLPTIHALIFPSPTTNPIKVLDYCCGTGNLTQSLLPALPAGSTIHGFDVSAKCIAVYNNKFTSADSPHKPAKDVTVIGTVADLSSGDGLGAGPVAVREEDGGDFWGYDLVVIGMGLHHLPSPELGVANLVKRLKTGGKFFIVDNSDGGSWAKAVEEEEAAGVSTVKDTVSVHGFSEGQLVEMYEKAGLKEVKYILSGKGLLFGVREGGGWQGEFVEMEGGGKAAEGNVDDKKQPTEMFFGAGVKA